MFEKTPDVMVHELSEDAYTMASACIFGATFFVTAYRFRRRHMLRVHNCSLNIVTPITNFDRAHQKCLQVQSPEVAKTKKHLLKFRTLFEHPLAEVLGGNTFAVWLVTRAAQKNHVVPWYAPWRHLTTRRISNNENNSNSKSPVLKLNNTEFHVAVLKSISNQVSSQFSDGYMHEAICGSESVIKQRFVVALTCEDSSQTFFFKTRSMVTSEDVLKEIAEDPIAYRQAAVAESGLTTRLNTVIEIAKEYREHPKHFDVVEIAIPKSTAAATVASSSSPSDDDTQRVEGDDDGEGREALVVKDRKDVLGLKTRK